MSKLAGKKQTIKDIKRDVEMCIMDTGEIKSIKS